MLWSTARLEALSVERCLEKEQRDRWNSADEAIAELRRVVEPLVTLSKEDSVSKRRLAFDRLRSKTAVGKLFSDIGPRFSARPGGYTRILKCGNRPGDNAPMAIIEFVEKSDKSDD